MAGDTLSWVREACGRIPDVPSLAFVHIPVPQVCVEGVVGFGGVEGGERGPQLHCGCRHRHLPATYLLPSYVQFMEVWVACPTVGRKQEDVACSARDTGLFDLARWALLLGGRGAAGQRRAPGLHCRGWCGAGAPHEAAGDHRMRSWCLLAAAAGSRVRLTGRMP